MGKSIETECKSVVSWAGGEEAGKRVLDGCRDFPWGMKTFWQQRLWVHNTVNGGNDTESHTLK